MASRSPSAFCSARSPRCGAAGGAAACSLVSNCKIAGGVPSGATSLSYQLSLDHADLTALVSMGLSARHLTPRNSPAQNGS